jgi:hypothetical protein
MPKAKNPITEEERSKRFEEEIRKRKAAGDFDQNAAENALDALVRRSAKGRDSPSIQGESDS